MRTRVIQLAALLVVGLPVARAQSLLANLHGSGTDESLGFSIAIPGDIDGDGVPDVAATVRDSATGQGMIRLLSGHDLSLIRNITSPTGDPSFSNDVAALGDVDGDGVPDVVGSSPAYPPGVGKIGRVEVFSGATGLVLHTLDGKTTDSELGSYLDTGPDVDGDGLPELLTTTDTPSGLRIHVYSTSTWSLLASFPGHGESCVVGDIDLDGVPDIAVTFTNLLQVVSTASGRMLLYKTGSAGYGNGLAPIGDIDGDGVPDLLVGDAVDDTPFPEGGIAQVLSGTTGETIQAVHGHQSFDHFGTAVLSAGDIDGDGLPDMAVGAPGMHPTWTTSGFGAVQVRSSASGSLLTMLRGDGFLSAFGRRLAGPVDFNGDGFLDLLVGSPADGTLVSEAGGLAIMSARFGVTQLVPAEVIASAPVQVEMHGYGFDPNLPIAITVAGFPATSVTWVSPHLLTFVPPAGVEDTYADVRFEQDGLAVVAKQALRYVGPDILDIYPFAGTKLGGQTVRIHGRRFATDGSTVVKIYAGDATIQSITETEIVITTPPYTPGSPFNVQVIGSTGSVTSMAFKQDEEYGTPGRGTIAGGTVCVLSGVQVNHATGTPKAFVGGFSGPEAQVLASTPTTMTIKLPALPEPDTSGVHQINISDPVKGNEIISNGFSYTPWLTATLAAEALGGGRATLLLKPDPAPTGPQFVTAWIGLPTGSPISQKISGFGGVLHELPWVFTHVHQPLPQPVPALELTIPPYDLLFSGFTLRFQVLISGEGPAKGTFTNSSSFVLP